MSKRKNKKEYTPQEIALLGRNALPGGADVSPAAVLPDGGAEKDGGLSGTSGTPGADGSAPVPANENGPDDGPAASPEAQPPAAASEDANAAPAAGAIPTEPEGASPALEKTTRKKTVRFRVHRKKKRESFYRRSIERYIPPRFVAGAALALLLALPVGFLYSGASFVRVVDNGRAAGFGITTAADADGVLSALGVERRPDDALSLSSCDDIYGALRTLRIARAFAVRIHADGATAQLFTAGDTVAAVLARAGLTLGEDDLVTPAADTLLQAGDEIVVQRVTYETRVVEEPVAAQPVTKLSPLLADGVTRVMTSAGRDGAARVEYRDKYIDGVLSDTQTLSSVYTKYPWNLVTLEGKSGVPASPLDGASYTDVAIVDGVPASYESVKTAQPCTAYSFKPGVWGGAGMYLVQGMVAVNPDEYDYGDLLYIASADGSFVYGWAIAADAGTAMMDGRVEIDCFFETYGESVLFGKRYLDVYVVGHLTQSQLEEYMAKEGMFRARIPAD